MKWLPRILATALLPLLLTLGCSRPPSQEQVSTRPAEAAAQQVEGKETTAADTVALLDGIIIPRLELNDATLNDAVSLIRESAAQNATKAQGSPLDLPVEEWKKDLDNQWRKKTNVLGINFYVHQVPSQPQGYVLLGQEQPYQSQWITVNLQNISSLQALETVANAFNLRMKVEPGKVLFDPQD